ncbi:nitrile hydratase accessory protein [Kaustia mangrovi]|uniref:nitrile hydratase accessory protein n=1 Tax=Kaustia mangrovi TaxID=2593653 RepID=UPI001FEB9C17|nr:nitrile hydratase accessory protein [Kaustia mangrovi]
MSPPDPDAARAALDHLPAIPRDGEGPVFAEPWQAQAFAMAVELHARGLFTWPEWAATLAEEIARAGPEDTGRDYYLHWLAALERMVAAKGAATGGELAERKAAWDRAARATPHGEPIVLGRDKAS